MSASIRKSIKVDLDNYELGELLSQVHVNDLEKVFKFAGIESQQATIKELRGRLENLGKCPKCDGNSYVVGGSGSYKCDCGHSWSANS